MSTLHTVAPQEILKQVRSIEIRTRKLVNEIFSGQYSSIFKGRGMEFSQVREYQPGDDPKSIDWNVTARMGHLFTKEFSEERELTIMLLIDASQSLFFGSRKNLKSEAAAELAALLSFSAIRNNDKVGLLIFTDQVEAFFPPRKGQRNILRLIREILTFHPKGHATHIASGLKFLARVVRRHAICFLISDFLSPLDYENPLRTISKRHDLIAVRILDRFEKEFSGQGRFLFKDLESGQYGYIHLPRQTDSEALTKKYQLFFSEWKKMLGKSHIDVIEIETGQPYIGQLLSFFRARAKRFR